MGIWMDIGGVYIFQLLLPSYASGNGRIAFTFFLWAKKNIFEDSMAPDFLVACRVSHLTQRPRWPLTIWNTRKDNTFRQRYSCPLAHGGAHIGPLPLKPQNRSFSLAVTEFWPFRGFQELSVGTKKITPHHTFRVTKALSTSLQLRTPQIKTKTQSFQAMEFFYLD